MQVMAAYQGRPGAYSELAARELLGAGVQLQDCHAFADVMRAVLDDTVQWGVLPVHNTLVGVIRESRCLLAEAAVTVADELSLPVSHVLLGRPEARFEQLLAARSHPVALLQCQRFLTENPRIQPVADFDTAGAVEAMMRECDATVGAIASAHAGEVYGAQVLAAGIQDSAGNATRFVLFRKTNP